MQRSSTLLELNLRFSQLNCQLLSILSHTLPCDGHFSKKTTPYCAGSSILLVVANISLETLCSNENLTYHLIAGTSQAQVAPAQPHQALPETRAARVAVTEMAVVVHHPLLWWCHLQRRNSAGKRWTKDEVTGGRISQHSSCQGQCTILVDKMIYVV